MNLYAFMLIYQDVFNPIYFLLLCALIVIYQDWKSAGGKLSERLLTIGFAWIVAYLVYRLYFILCPNSPQYVEDIFASAGFAIAIAIVYIVWKKKNFGRETIGAIVGAISVLIPYTFISPLWNISGHVAFTAAPAIYITALDRKWAWLLIIPLVMVFNRPYVGAHTVEQSIAGFFLGFLSLVGYLYVKKRR